MPTARQRPIIPKDNGYIDRKTICFKHIRELAVKHSPRWSLALGLKIKPKRSNMFPLHDDRQHALRRQDPLPQADQAAPTRNFFIRTNKPISRRRLKRPTVWWSQTGSNRRPHACKARALPTELWPRDSASNSRRAKSKLVGLGRLELPTSRLSSARSNQLSYKPKPIARPGRLALEPINQAFKLRRGAQPGGSSFREERETKTAVIPRDRPDWPLCSK